ncbi:MAG: hypothetical protein E6Q97_24640 [Desulfurellales bacterium]|nr:MAG: hypothetical protein E6Q97_24640 [Desulfurellales bacterium]
MFKPQRLIKITDEIAQRSNLTDLLAEEDLNALGVHLHDGYTADEDSRRGWLLRMQAALDLAMQITETKSFPWVGASNVAFPLVTIAAMQFHARAYPAIISGKEVARVKDNPLASERERFAAQKAAQHMNCQLLDDDSSWEEQFDRLLLAYSIVGCGFKKSYFGATDQRINSDFVSAKNLVVDYYAKSLETARRKTHLYELHRNDLVEGMRTEPPRYKNYEDAAWFQAGPPMREEEERKRDGTHASGTHDPSQPFSVGEQHCWLDLDGDGYEEPYVAIFDLDSKSVLRLVAGWDRPEDIYRNGKGQIIKIRQTQYFTKYGFIPSPDGSFYDIGFGVLLGPLNESVSTLVNQLIDAGTMKTVGGGFMGKGVKVRGGTYSFTPGEWKRVDSTGDDLRKNLVPLETPEPSPTLFQLLSLLIDYTNRIAGTMETMVGENPGQNTPKSNMDSMIEQGMKIYTALFKRCWRSMKEEFRKIYVLNGIYGSSSVRPWFLFDPRYCVPAADPNISSEAERRSRAILIAERAATVSGYNPIAVETNFLLSMKIEDPAKFYNGPPKETPPDPKVMVAGMKEQGREADRQLKFRLALLELMAGEREQEANIANLLASAQKSLAQAEGERDNRLIVAMQTTLAALKDRGVDQRARLEQLIKIAELQSEPERKTTGLDDIRRMVEASSHKGPVPNGGTEAGTPEGPVGPSPDSQGGL